MFTYMYATSNSKVAPSVARNVVHWLFHLMNGVAPGKGEAALEPCKISYGATV